MTQFYYRVRDSSSQVRSGVLEADGTRAAAEVLRQRGFMVVELKPADARDAGRATAKSSGKEKSMVPTFFTFTKKVGTGDIALFCRQFTTMIEAGVPLLGCLDILERQVENHRLRQALREVMTDLQSGKTLSESMRKHPRVFPNFVVSMVEAGELGGVLDKAFSRTSEYLEREHSLREKVRSAMYYPAALISICVLAVTMLMIFVVPNFVVTFSSMNVELPLPTRILLSVSSFVTGYWHVIFGSVFLLAVSLPYLSRVPRIADYIDALKISVPIYGTLNKKVIVARFCFTLSTLLFAGVPLLQSLEVVKGVAGNKVVSRLVDGAMSSVRDGMSLSEPLQSGGVFPPMVSRMTAIGEETGTIDQLLQKVAQFYDQEVNLTVGKLSSILEPVLVVIMGGVIGSIILSIMLPLFKVMSGAFIQ